MADSSFNHVAPGRSEVRQRLRERNQLVELDLRDPEEKAKSRKEQPAALESEAETATTAVSGPPALESPPPEVPLSAPPVAKGDGVLDVTSEPETGDNL